MNSLWLVLLSWMLWFHYGMSQSISVYIEDDPHFIGWYLGPSTKQVLTDPNFWTTSGQFAQGCSATPCTWATTCVNEVITYNDGSTFGCTSAHCYTMTIFQNSPNAAPSATNIFCAKVWPATTVYRELPAATTTTTSSGYSSTSSKSSSTLLSSTTPTSTSTSIPASISTSCAPTTSTPSPPSTALPTNTTLSEKTATSRNNQAWIAGAVIGPITAIAIMSGLIFWFQRRQNAKQQQPVPVVRLNEIWTPPPNRTYAKVYEKSASSLQELE